MPKPLNFRAVLPTAIAVFCATYVQAQEERAEMADALRSDGKIWVVVAVLAVIFAGIFAYLIRLDRKISRLERESR